MATVATARLLARQWHKSHIKSKSTCQLLLSSPYSSIQQPAASSLVISNCCQPQNHHHWHSHQQQQQQQQKRYQSDHLKQRAIDALKSKKNANTNTTRGASSNDTQKSPRNIVDKGGAISKNYAGGGGKADGGSKATQQPVTPPPVMDSVKSMDDATMPETPPNPTPSSSSSPSATTTPENITPSIALPVQEDNTSDSNVTDEDDASNKTTIATDDSNPWAHMHLHEFAPKIVVVGVGGAGTNAVNNMVASGLAG